MTSVARSAPAPAIVVGTPGRLLDHLTRGSVDGTQLGAVVLDEADRMLDLGFRDDLEAILGFAPKDHRTHLVSATFPREVTALANRVQTDPARIEGTPLGTANTDIEHLVHLVLPNERLDANRQPPPRDARRDHAHLRAHPRRRRRAHASPLGGRLHRRLALR